MTATATTVLPARALLLKDGTLVNSDVERVRRWPGTGWTATRS
ncbi:hypothetical protein SMICM17S_01402 [Streptomyces microflavus]